MDDLIAFVAARLDEEYASADMLVVQGDWWSVDKSDPSIVRSTFFHVAARCNEDELAGAERRSWHIAHYDPGRALREIAAKRAIVAEYAAIAETAPADDADRALHASMRGAVAAIAAVWNDHADYRPVN